MTTRSRWREWDNVIVVQEIGRLVAPESDRTFCFILGPVGCGMFVKFDPRDGEPKEWVEIKASDVKMVWGSSVGVKEIRVKVSSNITVNVQ